MSSFFQKFYFLISVFTLFLSSPVAVAMGPKHSFLRYELASAETLFDQYSYSGYYDHDAMMNYLKIAKKQKKRLCLFIGGEKTGRQNSISFPEDGCIWIYSHSSGAALQYHNHIWINWNEESHRKQIDTALFEKIVLDEGVWETFEYRVRILKHFSRILTSSGSLLIPRPLNYYRSQEENPFILIEEKGKFSVVLPQKSIQDFLEPFENESERRNFYQRWHAWKRLYNLSPAQICMNFEEYVAHLHNHPEELSVESLRLEIENEIDLQIPNAEDVIRITKSEEEFAQFQARVESAGLKKLEEYYQEITTFNLFHDVELCSDFDSIFFSRGKTTYFQFLKPSLKPNLSRSCEDLGKKSVFPFSSSEKNLLELERRASETPSTADPDDDSIREISDPDTEGEFVWNMTLDKTPAKVDAKKNKETLLDQLESDLI